MTNFARRPMTLHGLLARLIWACVLPLLLASAWLAWNSVQTIRDERDQDAKDLARAFAVAVDQHLAARIGALAMLAESPLLDDASRWPDLYREARSFQHHFGSHVILADADQRMLFNTRMPYGTDLPRVPHPQGRAALPIALSTGQPAVGDIVFGPIAREPLVAIAVPALRQGKPGHVFLTLFEVHQFQQRLEQVALPAGWSLALLDGTGQPIARRAPPGFDPGRDVDAADRFEARPTAAPWRVVLEIPRQVRWAPLLSAVLTLAATILGATLLALLGGHLASRRLGKAVASLARAQEPGAPPPDIAEIAAVRTRLDEAAASSAAAVGALSQSEHAYHSLFDNMLNSVVHARVIFDGDTPVDLEYLAVNPTFATITGITEDVVGRRISDVIPGYCTNNPESLETFGRVAASGVPVRWEHHLKELERWFSFIVYSPAPGEVVIVTENITERMQAELALRDSEQRFRALVEQSMAGIYIIQDGLFRYANPGFAAMFGYDSPEQIVDRVPVGDLVSLEDKALVAEKLQARVEGRSTNAHYGFSGVRRTGEAIDVEVHGSTLEYQGRPAVIGLILDVTERKRAEAVLRQSEESLRESQSIARVGSYALEVATGVWRSSDVLDQLFGIDQNYTHDLAGWTALVHPEDRDMMARYVSEEVIGRGVPFDKEYRIIRQTDQAERWMHGLGRLEVDAAGRVLNMRGTIQDITEWVSAEDSMRRLLRDQQAILESSIVSFVKVRDRKYVWVNQAFTRMFGYSAEEVIGQSTRLLYPSDEAYAEFAEAAYAPIRRGDAFRAEISHVRKDGSLGWFEVCGESLQSGSDESVWATIDVTERRKFDETLRASEQRFRHLFQEAPLPLCFLDKDGRIVDRNATFLQTFGYGPEDVPTIEAWWRRAYPEPEYRTQVIARWEAAVARAARDGTDVAAEEYRITCKDGSERSVLVSGITLDEGFLATFFDITERRQAEDALLERDFRLSAIIDNSPAVLSLKHPDGRYALANPNLQRIHHQPEQELIGKTDFDLYPAETANSFRANDARVLETMARHAIEETVPVDGLPRTFMSHIFPVLDAAGQARFICRISLDITDSKRADAEIKRLNKRITLATRAARVGIWDWDVANNRLVWDEQMYALYGVREEDFSGAVEAWTLGLHPEDRVGGHEKSASALRGESVYDTDFRVQWPDGSEHHLKALADVIRDGDGNPLRMIGVNYDVTELKQAEAEILRLNADLERRVQERTAELTAANRELDSFAYAVSHDLRAPLRAMNGFSQALEEDFGDQLPAEAKDFLGHIKIASCRMSDLVDGLLALSRSTRGEMRHNTVDLSALAGRLLEELARNEPDRAVTVWVEPGLAARGDERMIEVVMRNLLGNAWKYSAGVAAPAIRVYTREEDGIPHFCVADNGAGFDMAHAKRLFQPFQRLHRQDEFPGLGIGLATVQRIVHRHGGTVDATAEPGKGATFCFSLPGRLGNSPEFDKDPP